MADSDLNGTAPPHARPQGGGKRFVTKPCKGIGIYTVLRYEGGGQKSRKIAYVLCGRSLIDILFSKVRNQIGIGIPN